MLFRDLFCVSWLLGRYCNYSCSYCWPYASTRTKDHRSTELVIATLDEIKRQARERGFNSFHFSFSGGEPTMHPGYLDIVKHYADDQSHCNYQTIHMTSNCSPGIRWFEKYADATKDLHRVSITASYHSEFADREKFKDKLIFLQSQDIQVTINMVMVPGRFNALWEDALYFHESGINVTLKPQSNENATRVVEGYTKDQLDRMQNGMPQRQYTHSRLSEEKRVSIRPKSKVVLPRSEVDRLGRAEGIPPQIMQVELTDETGFPWYVDQAERFNAFAFNEFEGWECSSGFRSLVIREPDGFIKRSYSCNDQPLGHIETGFKLFDRPQICCTKSCVSSADSKIPKRRAGCQMPLWPGDETFLGQSLSGKEITNP
ncbi:MAG: radical SAM protein [Bdellovibrionaceae bacterium]|nr:radical SAM protein [Pseudobdellovibrionaceae bacterium]